MLKRIRAVVGMILLGAACMAASAAEHPAQTMVMESINAMLDVLKNEGDRIKSDEDYLQSRVDELIVPNIDFDTMTKLAVGKFWRDADDEQKRELVAQFKALLLNTYTGALT